MKKLVFIASLILSLSASAGELVVMDLPFWKVGFDDVSTWFKVDEAEGTVSILAHVEKLTSGRRDDIINARRFKKIVPELSMIDKTLTLTVDGQTVDCGTMGVTRIFKRPVLRLNGNCTVEERAVRTSEGRRFQLFIKY